MVATFSCQSYLVMIREGAHPIFRGEDTIELLQSGAISFIRPGVKAPLEMNLLELGIIQELPKKGHHAQFLVVLVSRLVDEVEISPHQLGSQTNITHLP